MEDNEIVNLYLTRSPAAISETAAKYGRYCQTIARNILNDQEDAEECVNDAYLHVWYSIPPHQPAVLAAYLGKITRNLSLDRLRHRHSDKRGGGETELVLEELSECVSGVSVEQEMDRKAMTPDMTVREVTEKLGDTIDVGSGLYILLYQVDGQYILTIPFAGLDAQLGVTGETLLKALQPIKN